MEGEAVSKNALTKEEEEEDSEGEEDCEAKDTEDKGPAQLEDGINKFGARRWRDDGDHGNKSASDLGDLTEETTHDRVEAVTMCEDFIGDDALEDDEWGDFEDASTTCGDEGREDVAPDASNDQSIEAMATRVRASLSEEERQMLGKLTCALLKIHSQDTLTAKFATEFAMKILRVLSLPEDLREKFLAQKYETRSALAKCVEECETTIANDGTRFICVQGLLLIALSGGEYDARARTLLIDVATAFNIPWNRVAAVELAIATHLYAMAEELARHSEFDEIAEAVDPEQDQLERVYREKRRRKRRFRRAAKVSGIAIAGGLVFGVTGGLIAPALLASLAGLGIAGAASLAATGSIASGAAVGSLFGAFGSGLAGRKARKRTQYKLYDFDFERKGDPRIAAANAKRAARMDRHRREEARKEAAEDSTQGKGNMAESSQARTGGPDSREFLEGEVVEEQLDSVNAKQYEEETGQEREGHSAGALNAGKEPDTPHSPTAPIEPKAGEGAHVSPEDEGHRVSKQSEPETTKTAAVAEHEDIEGTWVETASTSQNTTSVKTEGRKKKSWFKKKPRSKARKRDQDVEDLGSSDDDTAALEEAAKRAIEEATAKESSICLHGCLCVPGWISGRYFGSSLQQFRVGLELCVPCSEHVAVRWETKKLVQMARAFAKFWASKATVTTVQQVYPHLLGAASAVAGAVAVAIAFPLTVVSAMDYIDNPWSVLVTRANGAGEELADVLAQRGYGQRPVTLIGYSLGARVVFKCLESLAKRGARGIVDSAFLIGAPVSGESERWNLIRQAVSNRLVNGYCGTDWHLAFFHRGYCHPETNTSRPDRRGRRCNPGVKIAGLSRVLSDEVENVNLTFIGVKSHRDLQAAMVRIFLTLGLGTGYVSMPPAVILSRDQQKSRRAAAAGKKRRGERDSGDESDDSLSYWEEKAMRDLNQKAEVFERKNGEGGEGTSLLQDGNNNDECWTFEGDFAIEDDHSMFAESSRNAATRTSLEASMTNPRQDSDPQGFLEQDQAMNVVIASEQVKQAEKKRKSWWWKKKTAKVKLATPLDQETTIASGASTAASASNVVQEADGRLSSNLSGETSMALVSMQLPSSEGGSICLDANSFAMSIGIEITNRRVERMFEKNTSFPCHEHRYFTNCSDDQRAMVVRIIEGESSQVPLKWTEMETAKTLHGSRLLEEVEVKWSDPVPRGKLRFLMNLEADAEGNLRINIEEKRILRISREVTIPADRLISFDELRSLQEVEKAGETPEQEVDDKQPDAVQNAHDGDEQQDSLPTAVANRSIDNTSIEFDWDNFLGPVDNGKCTQVNAPNGVLDFEPIDAGFAEQDKVQISTMMSSSVQIDRHEGHAFDEAEILKPISNTTESNRDNATRVDIRTQDIDTMFGFGSSLNGTGANETDRLQSTAKSPSSIGVAPPRDIGAQLSSENIVDDLILCAGAIKSDDIGQRSAHLLDELLVTSRPPTELKNEESQSRSGLPLDLGFPAAFDDEAGATAKSHPSMNVDDSSEWVNDAATEIVIAEALNDILDMSNSNGTADGFMMTTPLANGDVLEDSEDEFGKFQSAETNA